MMSAFKGFCFIQWPVVFAVCLPVLMTFAQRMRIHPSGPLLVHEGGSLSWTCSLQGESVFTNTILVQPPITASRNGETPTDVQVERANTVRVNLRHARHLDSGLYTCEAKDILTDLVYRERVDVRVIAGISRGFCQDSEFRCVNASCIKRGFLCNGHSDCRDQSDEKNCKALECPGKFRCRSSGCVPRNQVCDRRTQCPDGSDEETCKPHDLEVAGAGVHWMVYGTLGVLIGVGAFLTLGVFYVIKRRRRRAVERARVTGASRTGATTEEERNSLTNLLTTDKQQVVIREDGTLQVMGNPPPYSEVTNANTSDCQPSAPPYSEENPESFPELSQSGWMRPSAPPMTNEQLFVNEASEKSIETSKQEVCSQERRVDSDEEFQFIAPQRVEFPC